MPENVAHLYLYFHSEFENWIMLFTEKEFYKHDEIKHKSYSQEKSLRCLFFEVLPQESIFLFIIDSKITM